MYSFIAFISMFSKSGVTGVCFEEKEVEFGRVVVVLVPGDGSSQFEEGTCDGSIPGALLEVGGVCFPLFVDAGDDCSNEVFKG